MWLGRAGCGVALVTVLGKFFCGNQHWATYFFALFLFSSLCAAYCAQCHSSFSLYIESVNEYACGHWRILRHKRCASAKSRRSQHPTRLDSTCSRQYIVAVLFAGVQACCNRRDRDCVGRFTKGQQGPAAPGRTDVSLALCSLACGFYPAESCCSVVCSAMPAYCA